MAKVLFTRTDANDKVETIPFKDGQIIYTKDGKTYLDYGTDRIELVSGGDTIPIGSVMPFAEVDSTSPLMSDWLLCDGRAVSRTTYSELFSLIGTTYGVGDGSTTFNLPDVKGRVIVGQDETDDNFKTLGAKIGDKEVTLTIAQMPRHNHGFTSGTGNVVANQLSTSSPVYFNQNDNGLGTTQIDYTGGGQAHNNIQPSLVLKYYIKTFRSASLTADVKNAETKSTKDTYSCDYINNLNTYSTDEIIIGKWVDNKPIYRKCIYISSFPNNATINVPMNIENLDYMINIYGVANKNGDGHPINGSRFDIPNYTISCYINSGMLVISTGADRNSYSGYIVVEYTKK